MGIDESGCQYPVPILHIVAGFLPVNQCLDPAICISDQNQCFPQLAAGKYLWCAEFSVPHVNFETINFASLYNQENNLLNR